RGALRRRAPRRLRTAGGDPANAPCIGIRHALFVRRRGGGARRAPRQRPSDTQRRAAGAGDRRASRCLRCRSVERARAMKIRIAPLAAVGLATLVGINLWLLTIIFAGAAREEPAPVTPPAWDAKSSGK